MHDEGDSRPCGWRGGASLRVKLLALSLALVVVPGSVFAWIAIAGARDALERAIGRQLAEIAQDVAERVESEVSRIDDELRRWSRHESLRAVLLDEADDGVSGLLIGMRSNDPAIATLLAADAAGRVVGASDPGLLGGLVRDRTWWPDVAHGVPAVAPGLGTAQEQGFELAVPIFASSASTTVVGALIAASSWPSVEGVLQHLQHDLATLGIEATVLLVDDAGRVLAGGWWEEPSVLAGRDLRSAGWSSIELARASGRAAWVREEAAESLVGYAGVAGRGLALTALAIQPLDVALAPVRALRLDLLITLGGVLIAALALAAYVAHRLSRPIHALTVATRELARTGEARAPVRATSRDEIGELASAFNRMAEDLSHARRDLLTAARFAFVGELAAGMAHEIRTPLGIVRTSAQMLGRQMPPDDKRTAELVDMIVSEVDRLDRVVTSLLELARPHEPLLEPVPLGALLGRALDLVDRQARERGIALRRHLVVPGPTALCDPEQIYQVALNLLMNALQILPRGGTIRVRTIEHGDRVGFEVSDDGPGIPAELHEKVFAPFFTRRPGGTGLGLSLVQRIVQAHHGRVSLASDVGRGATFRIELPAAKEAA